MLLYADAISSGDDEDDTERSEDSGADEVQLSEYGRKKIDVYRLGALEQDK